MTPVLVVFTREGCERHEQLWDAYIEHGGYTLLGDRLAKIIDFAPFGAPSDPGRALRWVVSLPPHAGHA